MFDYAAFIEELRPLTEQAKTLRDRPNLTKDEDFRRWRHELTDLITRIHARKYRINCRIAMRRFDEVGTYSYAPSRNERMATYNQALSDTITEMETLISRFKKYGDPKPEPEAEIAEVVSPATSMPAEPPKLLPPEKVTPAWLWEHATAMLWIQAAGVLIVAFSAGVAIGQSTLYVELISKMSPASVKAASSQPTRAEPGK